MTTKSGQKLKVSWTDQPAAFSQELSFSWSESDLEAKKSGSRTLSIKKLVSEQAQLEKLLGWSPGSISVLHKAFEKNLDRYVGWDLAEIKLKKDQQKFIQAAEVFKRGVPTSKGLKPKKTRGSYNILIVDKREAIDKKLEAAEFVVVDRNVERAWPYLEDYTNLCYLPVSEPQKSLASVAKILGAWKASGSKKKWLVIGGGITTDLVGFAAYLVGASVTMIPTTILAMVDASVGGKTGANFPPYGKNQIGAFYFPKEVVVWPGWLETLPVRHIKSGGSECLKHCLLSKKKILMTSSVKAFSELDSARIATLLPELIEIKSKVVTEDSKEMGKRAILNLGHTMAHGLEAVSHTVEDGVFKTLEHGEAVAIGICFSAVLSHHLKIMTKSEHDQIWKLFRASGCLIPKAELRSCLGVKALNSAELWKSLQEKLLRDKKQKNSDQNSKSVRFVLLKKIGVVSQSKKFGFTTPVPCSDIHEAWKKFIKLI